jgi:hypothetical protein
LVYIALPMKLSDRLDEASAEWAEGAALIVGAALLASVAIFVCFLLLSLVGSLLGKPSWWAQVWGAATALLWYPLAAGKVMRLFRRRWSSALTAQDRPEAT